MLGVAPQISQAPANWQPFRESAHPSYPRRLTHGSRDRELIFLIETRLKREKLRLRGRDQPAESALVVNRGQVLARSTRFVRKLIGHMPGDGL